MVLHFDMGMVYTVPNDGFMEYNKWNCFVRCYGESGMHGFLSMVSGKGSHDWFFQCYELLHPGVILAWPRDTIKWTLSSHNLSRPPGATICRWCLCGVVVVVVWIVINWEVIFQPTKCLSAFRRTIVFKFSYTITLRSLKCIFLCSVRSITLENTEHALNIKMKWKCNLALLLGFEKD
jgi:hypothetical protein